MDVCAKNREVIDKLRDKYFHNSPLPRYVGSVELRNCYYLFETDEKFFLLSEKFLENRADAFEFSYVCEREDVELFYLFLKKNFCPKQSLIIVNVNEIRNILLNSANEFNFGTLLLERIREKYADDRRGSGYKFRFFIQSLLVITVLIKNGKVEKKKKRGNPCYFYIPCEIEEGK